MRSLREVLQVTSDVFIELLQTDPDANLPERREIVTGELPHDCELFAVSCQRGIYPGLPGAPLNGYQSATGGYVPLSADVNVSLLRDVLQVDNSGRPPIEDDYTAASLLLAEDAERLGDVFYAAYNTNRLSSFCDNLAFGGVTFLGPLGGILETRLTFSIQL